VEGKRGTVTAFFQRFPHHGRARPDHRRREEQRSALGYTVPCAISDTLLIVRGIVIVVIT